MTIVFVAYFIAGKLGQATSNIRSSNLGPVWPAFGIAVAAFLAYGYRVWPASAERLSRRGRGLRPVPLRPVRRWAPRWGRRRELPPPSHPSFDPCLRGLRDAVWFIVLGAFGGAFLSSLIGTASLYATGIQPYSGLTAAWFIYWLGDSTGVLLVTPIVFTLPQLLRIRSRTSFAELAALVACSRPHAC